MLTILSLGLILSGVYVVPDQCMCSDIQVCLKVMVFFSITAQGLLQNESLRQGELHGSDDGHDR